MSNCDNCTRCGVCGVQVDADDGPQINPETTTLESNMSNDTTPAQPQYTGVDDPKLLDAARASLKERHPSLTDNDIENLVGQEANRLLNGDTAAEDHTG